MASKRPPNSVETTPSGFTVEYWDAVGLDGEAQTRRYRVDGEKLASISSVAGCMDKFALTPAAAKLERAGVRELVNRGIDVAGMDDTSLLAVLKEHGLHYDSIWGVARDRGNVAHDHLLRLVRDGEVARRSDYADDIWPWIQAGMKWVLDAQPEPIATEQMVASPSYGFAGRYDLLARFPDGRVGRIDYKSVSEWKHRGGNLYPPYWESLVQLRLYEVAAVESGYDAADFRMVIRLGPDGEYDATESHVTEEQALAQAAAFQARKDGNKASVAA